MLHAREIKQLVTTCTYCDRADMGFDPHGRAQMINFELYDGQGTDCVFHAPKQHPPGPADVVGVQDRVAFKILNVVVMA